MPYIDGGSRWFDVILCPQDGETFEAFSTRCKTGITALAPLYTDEYVTEMVQDAWNVHILNNSTEITVRMRRDLYSLYWNDWSDWKIVEILDASQPAVVSVPVAKTKAGAGEKYKIAKSVEDKQLVFGWANVALEADGSIPIDWDGDVTSSSDLESAAYSYVLKYRTAGEMHEGEAVGQLVESVMFTKEKQEALGIPEGVVPEGWWVGFHVPDKEVFAKIKSGEYEMFSVQGTGYRVPTGQ